MCFTTVLLLFYYCFTTALLLLYCWFTAAFQVHKVGLEEIGGLDEAKEALYEMLVLPREQAELCRRYQTCLPSFTCVTYALCLIPYALCLSWCCRESRRSCAADTRPAYTSSLRPHTLVA